MRKTLICLCLLFILSAASVLHAATNLTVSGIDTPAAANGRYIPNGTLYAHDSWKHESQNYYIYYDIFTTDSNYYWNIDSDTNDENTALFYSEANPPADSPANAVSWSTDTGTGSPAVTVEGAPEINVKGNGNTILDEDITPSFNDHTQFGSVDVSSGTATRTYTIENNGSAILTITGVTLSGTDASDFSVTTSPAASVAALGTTTFVVTFNPSAAGNRNATVSIANNDSSENPYTFNIRGYGFTPKDLLVSGITNPAANGNYIHQGLIFEFEYWKHETLNYYLFNDDFTGTRYWNIDVDTVDTDDDWLFYFESDAGSPVGLTGWTKNNLVSPEGDPSITEGTPVPEINVQGNGVTIPDDDTTPSFADHTHLGSLNVSSGTRTRTFTIQNTGGAVLNLTGSSPYVTIGGAAASDFSVTTPPSATIASTGSTTFVVTFDPSVVGTRTATVSIASDDSDENPYNFYVQGDGFTPKNLIVSGITNPTAANGNYIHQGILNEFQCWQHESGGYYIYNDEYSGSHYWNIDNNTDDAATYFYSNDTHNEDASPVTVTVWAIDTSPSGLGATGTPSIIYSGPEMAVEGNSVEINSGDATPSAADHTDFGSCSVNSATISRTYTIKNTGYEELVLSGTPKATISGSHAADFAVTSQPSSPVAATTGTTTFTVQFNPSGPGLRSATVSIANDDSDENPYTFAIQGTGTAPEMNVQGNGTTITDGDTSPSTTDDTDFGNQSVSSGTVSKIYTIQNPGNATLTLGTNAVSLSGGQSGDFSVTTQPATTVAASGSTTFTIQFDPSDAGTRSTTVSIANDDSDENPYNFDIQGTGTIGITINDVTVNENAGNAVFTITLSATSGGNITVDYATADNTATTGDNDYTNTSGTATINSGSLTTTVSVPITDDTLYEANETFYMNLSNANAGTITDAQGTGTINNEDNQPSVTLGLTGSPLAENGGTATVTATLSAVSSKNATINLGFTGTATNVTDYTRSNTSITINAGSTTGSITLTGVDDADDDNDETIIVDITGGTDCTEDGTQQLTATITDDENPEISISGNGQNIGDGDTSPSITDYTEFGNIDLAAGEVIHSFTITNSGTGALTLLGSSPFVTLIGHTGDFTITAAPSTPVAKSGGTTTFDIKFNPTAAGLRQATVSIGNDDPDENPFTFDIQGTGGNYPEIKIEYNGTEIVDGDATPNAADGTDFGQDHFNFANYSPVHTFQIINLGSSTLNLGGTPRVTVAGVDFSLIEDASSSIAAGKTAEFKVKFAATATVVRNGTISITNDDNGENPYNFSIKGTGYSGSLMIVQGGSPQQDIENGDTTPRTEDYTDLGSTQVLGGTIDRIFEIENFGAGALNLTGSPIVAISGAHADDFTVIDQPASSIGSGSNDTFTIRFDPPVNGLRGAMVSISNNDPNRNPYTFDIYGTGINREIDIQGNGTSITDGDTVPSTADDTDFGSTGLVSGGVTHTFTIENTGSDTLSLTGPSPYAVISGTHAGDFSVSSIPSGSIASGGGTTTFDITFDPGAVGLRKATVSIANDDSDENPYNFDIQGTALPDVTISGAVTYGTNTIEGVTITFSHNGHTETSAADGTYSYTVPSGTTTAVTPSHPGYSGWTPANRQLTNILAGQSGQDFTSTSDTDGISATEESGPDGTDPSYDGNGDGTPDSNQPNVASFHTEDGNNYVTLAAPDGMWLSDVQALSAPAPGTFSNLISFPYGLLRFTINGVTPGGAVQVRLILSGSASIDSYWKYGKEPGNATMHPYEFMLTGGTGAEILGNTVVLHFIDGQRGDDDLNSGNGVIVDDGGPASPAPAIPALSKEGMLVFMIMLSLLACLMIRTGKERS